ncbi:hypothetical protein M441DRAFT_232436 [Trichoderma asperellum CBS 433.97]|uniref:Uncharacterized protein n=1 Tax=Trichoderma asperellum (strain ATCC 204424 / CBS 433.97 / NBRC 101777) TaxID=1042311 RepID=A0A2T3ZQS6_TRIA4|nr:hypothetical protein M441DRAFT_232436 [Trichoderma asperellum CBS 433.97]PTB47158.1 hypothetical protein M441DRAFT_232436 [Trichoderma asperellum CBS 433.97]
MATARESPFQLDRSAASTEIFSCRDLSVLQMPGYSLPGPPQQTDSKTAKPIPCHFHRP